MPVDTSIPDLKPADAERFIAALDDAWSWAKHPTDAELEQRVETITHILRGQYVSPDDLNLLVGWYACNMPPEKQFYLSNVRVLQRVIDEHNLPQAWLGRVINQVGKFATHYAETHPLNPDYFLDPIEAILPIINTDQGFWGDKHQYDEAYLAVHAIYYPKSITKKMLKDYYSHYDDYKLYWEMLVSKNSDSMHIPRELVVQAQDALDHIMQEKMNVSRVISKAVFRPEAVGTQELKDFLSHYEENMERFHSAATEEGFPKDFEKRAKTAIAEVIADQKLEIPKESRAKLRIRKPNNPVDPDTVQLFAKALDNEMARADDRYEVKTRLRIFSALLKDPEAVSKQDIILLNKYCTKTLSEGPQEVKEAFSNREILKQMAGRVGIGLKYVSHTFKVLEKRGVAVGEKVVITLPADMLIPAWKSHLERGAQHGKRKAGVEPVSTEGGHGGRVRKSQRKDDGANASQDTFGELTESGRGFF